MGTEIDYKRHVVEALAFHGWRVQEHEDKQSNFIPDLSFSANKTDGWVEVKYCAEPPATLSQIEHWTAGQQAWLFERGRVGSGHCYLLVGTPHWNLLWRYDVLETVRHQSFAAAIGYVTVKEREIFDLAGSMHERITGRARVSRPV